MMAVYFETGSLDFFFFWFGYHAQHAWNADFNGSEPTASVSVTFQIALCSFGCSRQVWILGNLDLKIKKKL